MIGLFEDNDEPICEECYRNLDEEVHAPRCSNK